MSFLLRQVAHCDVCGHEWLTNKVPSHCAKCKSRKWNSVAPDYQAVAEQLERATNDRVLGTDSPKERTVEYEE